jgi:hypothetical protein
VFNFVTPRDLLATIWSVWVGSVLSCLNPHVQCHNERGAAPWIISFQEGKNGL